MMTAYKQNQLRWGCIMTVALTMGLLALYLSAWFAVPFLALVFVIPFVLKGIICPKCGTPVTYQGTFFGVRGHLYFGMTGEGGRWGPARAHRIFWLPLRVWGTHIQAREGNLVCRHGCC
jgi:hypothetical protein